MALLITHGFALISVCQGQADAVPQGSVPEHRRAMLDIRERRSYPRETIIRVDEQQSPARDPLHGYTFQRIWRVLIGEGGEQVERLVVHAPDAHMDPLARRVASYLGLLWGLADARFGRLCSRLRSGVVHVWLCREKGAGSAQQQRRDIYLYECGEERSGLEWLRALSHEFGHYILPGPAGYTDPEPWSNGVLGERLFLRWLRDELQAGTLAAEDLPFGDPEVLGDYCAKQPDALVDRLLSRGPDRSLLEGQGKAAMDEATALLLYVAQVHGQRSLFDLLTYLPPRTPREPSGPDFLKAYELWVARSATVSYRLPRASAMILLPSGVRELAVEGADMGRIRFARARLQRARSGASAVESASGGWQRVTIEAAGDGDAVAWTLSLKKP